MAKKKKRAQKQQKQTPDSSSSFGSSALADQLSRARVTTKIKKAAAKQARRPSPPPKPAPIPPEELLDGEELFEAALHAMPAPSTRHKQRGSSAFHGEFARQLQGHRPIAQRREEEQPSTPPQDTSPEVSPAQSPPDRDEPSAAPLTEDALFAHVVDTIQPKDLFAGKYHGSVRDLPRAKQKPAPFMPGDAPTHAPKMSKAEARAHEARARAELADLRDEMIFTRAVGGFDEVFGNQDKYHRQKPRAYKEEREERTSYSSEPPEGLITPSLPKSGEGLHHVPSLNGAQRELLNQARAWAAKHHMEALNVRGDGVEDALRQVELFFHQQWKDGARYARIVHGRGLQSEEGVPVLKPSILHWLEGPGFRYVRGYAPELTKDNDYGSVLVCLTQRPSRDKEQ
jgi:DNA-nicking Smr family endonuclease